MSTRNLETNGLQWRKARRSVNNGACVEVAPASGQMLVRDSTNLNGPVMRYSGQSWRMFILGTKTGRFDPDRLTLQSL
jgi:hypothetical protein